mmetsp:Transcript_35118/g.111642  ORF Transcript_35118/g.111642 Transcript_35118/m.111642 type:complete len:200 (+) Transcript_35118:405-1004(+)
MDRSHACPQARRSLADASVVPQLLSLGVDEGGVERGQCATWLRSMLRCMACAGGEEPCAGKDQAQGKATRPVKGYPRTSDAKGVSHGAGAQLPQEQREVRGGVAQVRRQPRERADVEGALQAHEEPEGPILQRESGRHPDTPSKRGVNWQARCDGYHCADSRRACRGAHVAREPRIALGLHGETHTADEHCEQQQCSRD